MQKEHKLKASIVIPVLNEDKFIENCVESIIKNNNDLENMEILIVDGGSTDNTIEIVERISSKYNFIRLLHNPIKITPSALNIAIKDSCGKFIVRLDAHAEYSQNYVNKCIEILETSDDSIANVGGYIETKPSNHSLFSKAISLCLSSIFGVGLSKFRILRPKKRKYVDTVPFGCFRRNLFEEIGFFNEKEPRNEDLEFNKRILNNGKKIILDPEISSTYYSRSGLTKLFLQQFDNGKIVTNKFRGKESFHKPRHFIPFLFFLYLISVPIFFLTLYEDSPFVQSYFLYLIPLILYVSLNLVFSLFLAIKNRNIFLFPYLLFTFFLIHFTYGLGSFFGLFLKEKKVSLALFLEKTFPYKTTFERKHFGFFTNLIKFFALRAAYFLYMLGLTANFLTISSVFLASISFFFLFDGINNELIFSVLLGYFLMCLVLFIDFVDGTLSRINNTIYKTGEALDNLPPDIIRVGSILLFGIVSESIALILISLVSSIIITRYIPETVENIKPQHFWIKALIGSRMSFSGLRLISLFIIPSLILVTFIFPNIKFLYSSFLVLLYFFLSFIWLILSLDDKEVKN
jgi:glycosyltransferase involved in cell wall biosynthesis